MNLEKVKISKILQKNANFVFFIDTEKTRHFKINLFLFKIIISIIILFLVFSIYSFISLFFLIKENNNLEKYITDLKKYTIKNYLDDNFLNNKEKTWTKLDNKTNQNKFIEEINLLKEEDEAENENTLEVKQFQTNDINKTISKISLKDKKINLTIAQDIGVGYIKTKIKNDDIIINFSLIGLNKASQQKIVSGNICGVLIKKNTNNIDTTITYPSNINLNKENIPENCNLGESVKFSRLRPSFFEFQTKYTKNMKLKVYIYRAEQNKVNIIKTIDLK